MKHGTGKMARYLNVYTKSEKPVAIKENTYYQNAECIKQMQRIPEYVRVMRI